MTKKQLSVIVIAVIAVAVIVYVVLVPSRGAYRIGADITLTGDFAFFGLQFQRGLQLAANDLKTAGAPVEIVYQDNRHDIKEAVTIFDRFTSVDNASAVISLYSPVSLALVKKAGQAKVPLVTTYTTAKDLTAANEWTFRDFPRMEDQVPPLAEYASTDLGVRSVACAGFNSDFGIEGCAVFRSAFERLGGRMPATDELLDMNQADVRSSMVKVMASRPEMILLVLSAAKLGQAVKNLRELGYPGKISGVIMFDSPEVWDAAGTAAEGVYFPSVKLKLEDTPDSRRFQAAYRERFKEDPNYMAVYGYTMGQYLISVVREAAGDRSRVRELLSVLDVESVRGRVKILPSRDIISPLAIYRRAAGKNELVREIASAR